MRWGTDFPKIRAENTILLWLFYFKYFKKKLLKVTTNIVATSQGLKIFLKQTHKVVFWTFSMYIKALQLVFHSIKVNRLQEIYLISSSFLFIFPHLSC